MQTYNNQVLEVSYTGATKPIVGTGAPGQAGKLKLNYEGFDFFANGDLLVAAKDGIYRVARKSGEARKLVARGQRIAQEGSCEWRMDRVSNPRLAGDSSESFYFDLLYATRPKTPTKLPSRRGSPGLSKQTMS